MPMDCVSSNVTAAMLISSYFWFEVIILILSQSQKILAAGNFLIYMYNFLV